MDADLIWSLVFCGLLVDILLLKTVGAGICHLYLEFGKFGLYSASTGAYSCKNPYSLHMQGVGS
jgi:hypothetical protein